MKDKIYFNNLNGLRFIAAFLVVVCHIELNKKYFNLPNCRESFKQLGVLGVDLFFVLSGFLITFLLLKEKKQFGKINFKSFYIRRVLRIWPLYYFILFLSLFILPSLSLFSIPTLHFDYSSNLELFKIIILFTLFFPNLLIFIKDIPFAAQSWSIGTEEQFYLIWPIVINRFSNFKRCFIVIIITYWLFFYFFNLPILNSILYIDIFRGYYALLKVDVLAIGALSATLLFYNDDLLSKLNNNIVFVLSCLSVCILYFVFSNTYLISRMIYAIAFAIIILNLVNNKKLKNLLENKILNYLGQISYGIYMYHQIVIVLLINLSLKYTKHPIYNCYIYFMSFILTIILSHISFQFLEKPFLNIKLKYAPFENRK